MIIVILCRQVIPKYVIYTHQHRMMRSRRDLKSCRSEWPDSCATAPRAIAGAGLERISFQTGAHASKTGRADCPSNVKHQKAPYLKGVLNLGAAPALPLSCTALLSKLFPFEEPAWRAFASIGGRQKSSPRPFRILIFAAGSQHTAVQATRRHPARKS